MATAKKKAGGGPRRRVDAETKRYDALVLYTEAHLPFREIGRRLGVSHQRAFQYVQEALREMRVQSVELAEYNRDREIALAELEIREAVEMLSRKCDVCHGAAVTDLKHCPVCLGAKVKPGTKDECEKCNGDGTVGEQCRECERTGNFYSPDQRLRAIDRMQRASEQRSKLLHLYDSPVELDVPYEREFYESLQSMSDEELERELQALLVPVTTGEKRGPRPTKTAAKAKPGSAAE